MPAVNCADPEAIASSWSGYELSNRDLLLATFDFGDLGADYSPFDGATCEAMCTADPWCIAYQENDDGGNECAPNSPFPLIAARCHLLSHSPDMAATALPQGTAVCKSGFKSIAQLRAAESSEHILLPQMQSV